VTYIANEPESVRDRWLAGTLIGVVVGIVGFFIASTGLPGMGFVMFLMVPVVAGGIVGWLLPMGKAVGKSALASLLISLLLLVAGGREGVLCALMAFPLLLVCVVIGAVLGVALRKAIKPRPKEGATTGMLLLAAPLLLFAGRQVERPLLNQARIEVVSNSVHIDAEPSEVWTQIQSIDAVKGSKPWLMHVGLPVPQRCTLAKAAVGARRTCYFDKGYIEETVTTWDPPRHMGLRIDRTHMPGRHWLGFENADYWLQPEGNGTRLTRTTTISSHLFPVWYWRPLERWGVSSEHRYILEDAAISSAERNRRP
jgi:hypothetical protein